MTHESVGDSGVVEAAPKKSSSLEILSRVFRRPSFLSSRQAPADSSLSESEFSKSQHQQPPRSRVSDFKVDDLLVHAEAKNPNFRRSNLGHGQRYSSHLGIAPASFEEVLFSDFESLLEFARSQHAEESLAFWLAVEEFRANEQAQAETREEESLVEEKVESLTFLGTVSARVSNLARALLSSSFSSPSTGEPAPKTVPRTGSFQALTLASLHPRQAYARHRKWRLEEVKTDSDRHLTETMLANLRLKSALSPSTLGLAHDIYVEFLDEDAVFQISLNDDIAHELQRKREAGEVSLEMFDEAQKLVFGEMKTNLFPGYLNMLKQRRAKRAAEAAAEAFHKRQSTPSLEEGEETDAVAPFATFGAESEDEQ